VLVEQRKERDSSQSPLRGSLPSAEGISSAHYHVAFMDSSRVAGRDAQIIAIRPKDSYRYGYRLWIDEATAMPLKSQLWDDQGSVVEQILFADIKLPDSIPESRVKPSLIVDSFVWTRSDGPTDETKAEQASAWLATEMPAGFTLMTAVTKMTPGGKRPMEQLVYTDGLASVSVFIEDGVAESDQAEGWSQIGAANAYTTTLEGRLVTAVGEVPARTVEMIALSLRPVAAAP
jgi:sigma-E factor negative regulatory protein RseB